VLIELLDPDPVDSEAPGQPANILVLLEDRDRDALSRQFTSSSQTGRPSANDRDAAERHLHPARTHLSISVSFGRFPYIRIPTR
jgi:hypothetical protein